MSESAGRARDGAEVVVGCSDLDAAVAFLTGAPGFRLDMIYPADAPRAALLSGHGLCLRLDAGVEAPRGARLRLPAGAGLPAELTGPDGLVVEPARPLLAPHRDAAAGREIVNGRAGAWRDGRAGMQYRDLLPDRLGGRLIASHIRIPEGGPVPDYVHYHRVDFQVIFCRRGRVRVVYEDQGDPIVMEAGDCVLQPPGIRHRVLEASDGLEVIEVAAPAEHETWVEHDLALPTGRLEPHRQFGGQRFVFSRAAEAAWAPWRVDGFEARDTGVGRASGGAGGVTVARPAGDGGPVRVTHDADVVLDVVLAGRMDVLFDDKTLALGPGDAVALPPGKPYALNAPSSGLELLEVTMPATFATTPRD